MNNKKALNQESIKKSSTNIIPKEIRNLKCFICYDKDKAPINPETGETTTSGIQNRWSYQTALQGVEKYQNIKGIGVILGLTSIGNLCGLDIDDCINDKGEIAPEAMEIINQLNTYSELSPSSKGIHCLFFAKKSGDRCKNSDLNWCKCLELYDHNRYFTFTGDSINNKPIEHRQAECDRIYQNFFEIKENNEIKPAAPSLISSDIEKDKRKFAKGLEIDTKLSSLYNGARTFDDESRSDLALLSKILYWTNCNEVLAISLFLSSIYALTKDEKHKKKLKRKDYLQRTLQRAKRGLAYGKL